MADVKSKQIVKLTEGAILEIRKLLKEYNISEDQGVRIGVKGGGCSGFSYILGFDKLKQSDDVFEQDGIKIYMEKAHGLYLAGMEVDFHDGLNNRGFVFNNPNASDTCGCGTSFSA